MLFSSNELFKSFNYWSLIILCIIVKFGKIFNQINDDFKMNFLSEETGKSLIDVKDYHNLKLIISTSGNIYKGIPPEKIIQTDAPFNNFSSVATLNENYILAACINDSLLSKIDINTGIKTSLLSYSEIITPITLKIPSNKICSISIFENLVFIGYSSYTNSMIKNIVIKVNIKNKDDENGPILDISLENKYFLFPNEYTKCDTKRQIGCEAINITNDINDYRLICAYESQISKYQIMTFIIKNNFEKLDSDGIEYNIDSQSSDIGFILYKIDSFHLRIITRKTYKDLYLENNNGILKMIINNLI